MIQTAPPSPLVLCRRRLQAKGSLQAKATFGMGCFWKPSEELLKVEGVLDTICGYTGNDADPPPPPPTYDDVCFGSGRWVEAVRVEYDDATLTYSQLLDAFWQAQDPRPGSRQYASVIFPHDEQQEEIARAWLRNKQQQETRSVRVDSGVNAVSSASKAGYYYDTTIEATRTASTQRPLPKQTSS